MLLIKVITVWVNLNFRRELRSSRDATNAETGSHAGLRSGADQLYLSFPGKSIILDSARIKRQELQFE